MALVTKTRLRRELKEAGLTLSFNTLDALEELGLYELRKVRYGKLHRYVCSRKEAEKIKRLIWAYYYGVEPYPDDIQENGK